MYRGSRCTVRTWNASVAVAGVQTLAALCVVPAYASAQEPAAGYSSSRIWVRFTAEASANAKAQAHAAVTTLRIHEFRFSEGLCGVTVPDGTADAAIAEYTNRTDVLYARRAALLRLDDYSVNKFPDDPEFPKQWGLHNTGQTLSGTCIGNDPGSYDADIDAPLAWDIWLADQQADQKFRIAVIDTGIDLDHPDLLPNLWVNPGEDLN